MNPLEEAVKRVEGLAWSLDRNPGPTDRQLATDLRLLLSAVEGGGWMDISTAPKDAPILIWSPYGVGVAQKHWAADFTHWQPLPLPPAPTGEGDNG